MRRGLRFSLYGIAGLLVLAVGAGVAVLSSFDPDSEKPRIIALVKQATGRDLVLNGRIGLKLSLQPTLEVKDVAFANPPGFARPQMVTLQRLELQLRLLPLLSQRIEIARLVLIHPDIQLETNLQGQPNWQFAPAQFGSAPAPATTQAPSTHASPTAAFSVQELRIEGGQLTYRDDTTGRTTTLDVQQLSAEAASADAPQHLTAAATFNGTGFTLIADTGSLARLQDPATTTPWPLKLALQTGTAKLDVDGALTQPMQGRGYTLRVTGAVPDLAALAPLVPAITLPPLHDVTFNAQVADQGGKWPAVSAVSLHAGSADLGTLYPELALDRLDIDASAPDQPGKATIALRIGDLPVNLDAKVGPPLITQTEPVPVDVTLTAAGATLTAKGTIAQPSALSGANLALSGQVPDLGALSPLVHHPLPVLKSLTMAGTITDTGGGFANGLALRDLRLTTPDGDLAGELALQLGPKPSVAATLTSDRIDVDALKAALAQPAAAAPPPPAPPARSAPPPATGQKALPRDLLKTADLDLTLSVATLHAGGADFKTIAAHLVLTDGAVVLDPVSVELPAGRMTLKAEADTGAEPIPVSLAVHAPGLPLRPMLALFDQPATATGNLEVYADLHSAGDTPHAIAAALDGSVGIAMVNGSVDNRLMGATLGRILTPLNALNLAGRGGSSDLRCLAARLDFLRGTGTVRGLALSSSALTMTGTGSVNLGSDTLDLQLKPHAKLAGTILVVPMHVTGPIGAPATRIERLDAAEDNAGTVAGAIIGDATPLGLLGGMLGADKLLGGGDVCPGPLALARGDSAPSAAGPKPSRAGGFLQQLFH